MLRVVSALVTTSRLRNWRTDRGLTIQEVSDLTGLSVPFLSRVERGERHLSAMARVKFARRLEVPVAELFELVELDDEEASVATERPKAKAVQS